MNDFYGKPLKDNSVPKLLVMTIPTKNSREAHQMRMIIADILKTEYGIHRRQYKSEIKRKDYQPYK